MAKREAHIDGVRLYSDNLEGENAKTVKTKSTTTRTVIKENSNPTKTVVTKRRGTIQKDFGIPRHSITAISGNIQEVLAEKHGQKEKYEYKGKLKEKENYLYYVSGIGYVTKEGVKVDNKPKEIKVLKEKPKPTREVGPRQTITLHNTRPPRKQGELIENFEYHETKDIGKHNKESLVVHKRKGDPFYQSITGKRSSSYTQKERSRVTVDKSEYESKTKTIETKTVVQKNQYQNKTYNTNKVSQSNQSGTGAKNKIDNKSAYQKTINVEERKRNILPKQRFEKTYTGTNYRKETSTQQKKYVPTQKNYQEKTDENNKRKTQAQNLNQNLNQNQINQKIIDTDKYKRNVAQKEQSKYQNKTEEARETLISEEQNLLNDPNYCPIHGYHGQGEYEDIENYRFYESKSVSRRNVENINTDVNMQNQNIVNMEDNQAYIAEMNQEQMAQAEAQQEEGGYDMSKLYIATRITPVYSEMLDQRFQTHTHVCRVCGNPFDENEMDMMQENQINSMQEMEYDINCPIHGQNATQ